MRAGTGPRIAVLSVDGWDTHSDQGANTGYFNDHLAELDLALGDVKSELGTVWSKTAVICVTEFGRTVQTNGDSGTDHGVGTVALLVGGALKGGIIGDWPGIGADQLYEDTALTPTVDLRSIFKGVLRDHIGVPTDILDTTVFPESALVKATESLIGVPTVTSRRAAQFSKPPTMQDVAPIRQYRRKFGI